VPCSTAVGSNGPSVIYSTYLTASYYPTVYTTDVVVYPTATPAPQPTIVTAESNCPAQATVTVTIGGDCHDCQTKTYTVTESGTKTTFTVTIPPTQPASSTNGPSKSSYIPSPPISTGVSSSGAPHSTGSVPYPTGPSSSVIYSSSHAGPQPTGYKF
jgi:hypothetical protein